MYHICQSPPAASHHSSRTIESESVEKSNDPNDSGFRCPGPQYRFRRLQRDGLIHNSWWCTKGMPLSSASPEQSISAWGTLRSPFRSRFGPQMSAYKQTSLYLSGVPGVVSQRYHLHLQARSTARVALFKPSAIATSVVCDAGRRSARLWATAMGEGALRSGPKAEMVVLVATCCTCCCFIG